ncbi:MAG: hypothetical protein WBC44_14355 [Planctomycetaceae bacterium]
MRATNSAFESVPEHYRRAGGRRSYNARRQLAAEGRRHQVARIWCELKFRRGAASEIARRLEIHRSTVCRDLQVLDLMVLHGYEPWQLALIRRDDRTIRKLVHEPIVKRW